jgi:acetyl-CoA carboxylase biotin carboxyl carrier protein
MVRLPEKGADEHGDGHDVDAEASASVLAALSHIAKELIHEIASTDINEVHIEHGPVRITVKRGMSMPAPAAHASGGAFSAPSYPPAGTVYTPPATLAGPDASSTINMIGQSPIHGEDVLLTEGEQLIVAPMVGTFYAASSPDSDAYVSEGDPVEPGQVVGIIEAMKMMNQIESEVTGTVSRILVKNAQPVEYGQPLMVVSANGSSQS